MGFSEAVKTCLSKYVTLEGRARRSEYWYFALFAFLCSIVLTFIGGLIKFPFLGYLASIALFLPSLAVAVRRLHDTDRSGWWYLIGIVPIVGVIWLLVLFCTDSKPDNQYGPNPKGM